MWFATSGRSLIYKRDSNGPSTLPCGTPKLFILNCELLVDKVEFYSICCLFTPCIRLDKYRSSHNGAGPLIPYCSNFCNSNSRGTKSKALDKSKNISFSVLLLRSIHWNSTLSHLGSELSDFPLSVINFFIKWFSLSLIYYAAHLR